MNTTTNTTHSPTPSPHSSSSETGSKAVAWLGVTGSILLMVSATIFVWSGWNTFDNAVKVGIIALIAALCYGTGTFLRRSLPMMGSIFTHLSIFLTPVVLLSVNMEGIFPWRQFLIFEGIFCVVWFYSMSLIYKSPVLVPAAALSTLMIPLGVSALDNTPFGKIPASVYAIPIFIGLACIPRLSRASLAVLVIVGFSPVLHLMSDIKTGRGVLEAFGFLGQVHWYFSLAVTLSLLATTILSARVQKSLNLLMLIPITVIPHALLTLADRNLARQDLLIIAPVVLLIMQSILFACKTDGFFGQHIKSINQAFNWSIITIESFVALIVTLSYIGFVFVDALIDDINNTTTFFTHKQAIGLLLFVCVAVISYLGEKNIFHEMQVCLLGAFGVGALIDLTSIADHTHRETRMIIASAVIALVAVIFKKNYLASVLVPVGLTSFFVTLSDYSTKFDVIAVAFLTLGAGIFGFYALKKTQVVTQWFAAAGLAIFVLNFSLFSLDKFLTLTHNQELTKILVIFLLGLAITETIEIFTVGNSYIFASDSGVAYLRPARVMMIVSYASTWWITLNDDKTAATVFASLVVVFGIIGTWRRRESLTMILTAPTLVSGVYTLCSAANFTDQTAPLVLMGLAGVFLFASTYFKYASLGCVVNTAVCTFIGFVDSLDQAGTAGQALFILGLVIVAIGVIRSIPVLIPVGVVASSIGLWISLAAENIHALELYVAPICIGLIFLGMYERNMFPGMHRPQPLDINGNPVANISSWAAYAYPIVLFEGVALVESIVSGLRVHSLIGGVVAVIALSLGAWRKLSAPLFLGTVFLFAFVIRELFHVTNVVPIWAWVGLGAAVLIGVAITLEKSQMNISETRKKVSAVISDNFE